MLSQQLIESALQLTWKTMEDISILCNNPDDDEWYGEYEFSIKYFFVFLLSPEFLDKYFIKFILYTSAKGAAWDFWVAIYEYQSGNEKPLIELLKRIWKQPPCTG